MKPQGKVIIQWNSNFAYALGLLATDGCISGDGRHILLTSKDREQIENFRECVGITNSIGMVSRGSECEKKYFRIQFGDVLFHRFLIESGIPPAKSKILSDVKVPDEYFFDFLRGHHDGDGSFYAYWDPRWRSSYMFYLTFLSASRIHIEWLRKKICQLVGVSGHINVSRETFQLKYAKKESLQVLKKMYYKEDVICLSRKRKKIENCLNIAGQIL